MVIERPCELRKMKIKLFHRQPLPGARTILKEGAEEPFAMRLEADGLFDIVVARLPPALNQAIAGLANSDSEELFEERYEAAVTAAVAVAGPGESSHARVMCPLCGNGPVATYEGFDGFLYPFGLMKHLSGHQRTYECPVMASARRRASHSVALSTRSTSPY